MTVLLATIGPAALVGLLLIAGGVADAATERSTPGRIDGTVRRPVPLPPTRQQPTGIRVDMGRARAARAARHARPPQ
ncbi:hypothetical protein ACIP10_15520 [Streptomyces galbus]|uniref:hypothetical protein n=1 Tax=Streptomyces galbus TaxID=33898 RepID=UPI0037AA6217